MGNKFHLYYLAAKIDYCNINHLDNYSNHGEHANMFSTKLDSAL